MQRHGDVVDGLGRLGGQVKVMRKEPTEILLPDGLSRLFRGPGGKGTPINGLPQHGAEGADEFMIALGDLQVTHNRLGAGGDLFDVADCRDRHWLVFLLPSPSHDSGPAQHLSWLFRKNERLDGVLVPPWHS
jgi:hypothetical protein